MWRLMGMIVDKAAPYHAMAEACRSKADRAPTAKDKAEWLSLADDWLGLLGDVKDAGESLDDGRTAPRPGLRH